MIKVTYFQPEAKDPILENKVVLDIVRKYVPNVDTVDFVDETGGEARTYSINNRIILKVQRPNRLRNKTSLNKEVFFLKELEKYDDIIVPYVYGYEKTDDIEYICMSKINGKALYYSNLTKQQIEEVLYNLGKTLYKIHNIDKTPFIKSNLFPNDINTEGVKSRIDYEFTKKIKKINDLNPLEIKNAHDLKNKLLNKITKLDKFVILHSNPAITHTFVGKDHKFSGLIDFGDALISHPIIDIKRWDLKYREFVLKGYFSEEQPSDNFKNIIDIVFSLDNIIEILKKQKK